MAIERCRQLFSEFIKIEMGSVTVLDRSGNVRPEKKKVSYRSISLVFAEAELLSEVCCGPDTSSVQK